MLHQGGEKAFMSISLLKASKIVEQLTFSDNLMARFWTWVGSSEIMLSTESVLRIFTLFLCACGDFDRVKLGLRGLR